MVKQSVVCLVVILASVAGVSAQPRADHARWAHRRADDAVTRAVRAGRDVRVIVRYRAGARARMTAWLQQSRAGGLHADVPGLQALAVELSAEAIAQLADHADTLGISLDAPVQPTQFGGSSAIATRAAADDAQALRRTLGLRATDNGRGVGVAVIDSGIAPAADLDGRIAAFYDFTGNSAPRATLPSDPYGHGTHVAGLIAGSGRTSGGRYVGVADQARLIGLRVLDAAGAGYTSDVVEAIDFAVAQRRTLGIDIINLSLGHPVYERAATDPLVQAVERASRAGIVVVVSAGNIGLDAQSGAIGYGGITSPGNAPSVVTVGASRHKATAVRSDDEVAAFSSRGPTWFDGLSKPDVLAPGQALIATAARRSLLAGNPQLQSGNADYLRLSGTSMSAGVVSGVIADMLAAHRAARGATAHLRPNAIKAILMFTALPLPDDDPATPAALEQGAGGVNAAGAIALARAIDPRAQPGTLWLTTAITPQTTIAGESQPWATHIVWGDHIVLGDTVLFNLAAWDESVVWGGSDHVVWGDSFTEGLEFVVRSVAAWGEHIVWGDADHVVWGDADHIVWGDDDHVVWGDADHVVWGDDDHVVWGDSAIASLGE